MEETPRNARQRAWNGFLEHLLPFPVFLFPLVLLLLERIFQIFSVCVCVLGMTMRGGWLCLALFFFSLFHFPRLVFSPSLNGQTCHSCLVVLQNHGLFGGFLGRLAWLLQEAKFVSN